MMTTAYYVFVRTKKHWWSRAKCELRPYLTASSASNSFTATWTPPTSGSVLHNGRPR